MTKDEYKKLIDLTLSLRLAESMLAEVMALLKKANEVFRELILKEKQDV